MGRYALLNPPFVLELRERLEILDVLIEQHREPTDAAEALKKLLAETAPDPPGLSGLKMR